MKKNSIVLILLLLANTAGFASNPGDGDNLHVYTKGSTRATAYSLDNLDKLTFGDYSISVWMNNGRTDYSYGNISLLTFRESIHPTSVESLIKEDGNIRIYYDRSVQMVKTESPMPLENVQVFSVQGSEVVSKSMNTKSSHLSLAGLPRGVYIVNVKGKGVRKSVRIIK